MEIFMINSLKPLPAAPGGPVAANPKMKLMPTIRE
jgi:hypothetical protein